MSSPYCVTEIQRNVVVMNCEQGAYPTTPG